ncbi:NAD(P)/FAD-dependent oxidoreductase [Rhizobium leguminosarum]
MPKLHIDLLIVGAGPAGNACALQFAKRGGKVVIVEDQGFSTLHPVEVLSSSALPLLRSLDVVNLLDYPWVARSGGVISVWGQQTATLSRSLFDPHGDSFRIDRNTFDRFLFDQATAAGAAGFVGAKLVYLTPEKHRWRFSLSTKDSVTEGVADRIVAASGRNRNAPGSPSKDRIWIDRLVGIAIKGDGETRTTRSDLLYLQSTPNGWWYMVTSPSGASTAVFLTDADLLPRGKSKVSQFLHSEWARTSVHADCHRGVASAISKQSWVGFNARTGIRKIALTRNWLAIGDALASVDPLSGRGIVNALSMGKEAADWLLSEYEREPAMLPDWVHHVQLNHNYALAYRNVVYGMERRWERSAFWQRRHVETSERLRAEQEIAV